MYGKVFTQMYDGTLATRGPWQALVTFQQFIVLSDKHGVVDMTAEAIARRTTIPLEIINAGIAALELPDDQSRTPDLDGRRIVRLNGTREWGWQIVNYTHYRNMRSQEERREYMRKYQREYRAKHAGAKQNAMQIAHRIVKDAVRRGELVPMDCETCGSKQTEAHHEDYAKPLAVRWFCRAHHQDEHRRVDNSVNKVNEINQSSKQYAVSSKQVSQSPVRAPASPDARTDVKTDESNPKPAAKRATRLAEDWRVPDDWLDYATQVHAIDRQRAVRISLAFRDYWISVPGAKGCKLNWLATWRNWLRKECGE